MTTLTTETKNWAVVVSLKDYDKAQADKFLIKVRDYFVSNCCGYVMGITHDMDIDDRGELKTLHIHLVMELFKRKKCSALINFLSGLLDVSSLAVSVRKADSLASRLQYLIHKNDPDKFQYPKDSLIGHWESSEFELLLQQEPNDVLDFRTLFKICENANNKVEIMEKVGLTYYRIYRPCIDEIWQHLTKSRLADKYKN